MRILGSRLILASIIFVLLLSSCKKDVIPDAAGTDRRSDQLLKDSIVYYYNLYSLWSDGSMPESKAIYSFSDTYQSPRDVLAALKSATPFHSGYGGSIDRFSYLHYPKPEPGFGLYITIAAVSDIMAYPVIYYVEGASPADRAGLRRSDIILGIDGFEDMSIPISCSSGNCWAIDPNVQQSVMRGLLEAMEGQQIKLNLRHGDGSESSASIASEIYTLNSLIKHSAFEFSSINIGYLAFSSFEEYKEEGGNSPELEEAFRNFEQQGIQDLIIDVRYNSGGSVRTAGYLANKIIQAEHNGALMYTFELNRYLKANSGDHNFNDVYFRRQNNLDLKTVYFLVSDRTASAAELLINVLRPYMNVVLIAEGYGTFGKPVGYFKQELMGNTNLWIASFKMVNANGETDYFDGIGADIKHVPDDVFHDFGDMEESMIATAIGHALRGRKTPSSAPSRGKASQKLKNRNIGIVNKVPQREMMARE